MKEDLFQLGIKVIIVNDNKVLLLQVNPDKLRKFTGEPYWDIPGGRIVKGGSVKETLIREVFEETGITNFDDFRHVGMTLSNIRIPYKNSDTGLILSVYRAELKTKPEVTLSEEHINYKWSDWTEVKNLLGVKYPKEFIDLL